MAGKVHENLWYKDSIMYALNVRSFFDSNNDGIGDFRGLIEKLDYLEDLGVNCLSLLPFYESPLRDDGYDISDFCKIHPDLGTLEDFKNLLSEAHKRGMNVLIDLILNHTSTQHEWFQLARKSPPFTPERDFYLWSDTQQRYHEARIMFTDFETSNWAWDTEAKAYYFHRFYSHQADLNYDNPLVREEIRKVIDFWFNLGVDGMRLTSVMFLYKREHSNCENLPETHEFLKRLRRYVDERHPGKVLIAETNLWPEDAAAYYGDGDECHLNYHYPLMPRLYMALQTEDSYPITDIFEQTPPIPEACQWALFLRNHDDLTLSMVTEEERDYLYKVFAQDHGAKVNQGIRRRLAPLLGNDRRKIELLNTLLFSLPGSPVIYYGDEIGMGDNIYLGDRNGIRTPMQWNSDRNAGFSNANPQKLFLPVIRDPLYRYEAINVETQNSNASSLLWWTKNLVAIRKRLRVFGYGDIQFLNSGNSKVLAFLRSIGDENILVVCNLSKYSQAAAINLRAFKNVTPVEIFSQNRFLPIESEDYTLTLGPYGYYWFWLEKSETLEELPQGEVVNTLEGEVEWPELFANYTSKRRFEKRVLPNYLRSCRWFGGKSRNIVSIDIPIAPAVQLDDQPVFFLNIEVRYTDGLPETYCLPAAFVSSPEEVIAFLRDEPRSVICYLNTPTRQGILIDALYKREFRNGLFEMIRNNTRVQLPEGELFFEAGKMLQELQLEPDQVTSEILRAEQSNTSVIYNNQFFFKIYRKLDTDINPDLELVRFLSEKTNFENSPRYGGGIQYSDQGQRSFTIIGLMQNKIQNQGEAWTATLEELSRYYEKVTAKVVKTAPVPDLYSRAKLYFEDIPELHQKLIGSVMYDRVVKLAQRTAEMHIALATDDKDPAFKPERFTEHYQRSIYAGHRKLVSEQLNALGNRLKSLPRHTRAEVQAILDLRPQILDCFSEIYAQKINATKIRIHGDYHLGQVLFSGKDFYIIDFEGEPMHSISERRLKKTPFKDVAGMIRSYHYAAYGQLILNQNYRQEDLPFLEEWALQWFHYIRQFYLTAYYDRAEGQSFLPDNEHARNLLLRTYTLDKAIYEVGYELNSRPDWLRIPLKGVLYVMNEYLAEKGFPPVNLSAAE